MKKLSVIAVIVYLCASLSALDHLPRGPVVVADVALTAQTSTFSPATVYTPTEDGNYRVSVYTDFASASGSPNVQTWIEWTDDTKAHGSGAGIFVSANSGNDYYGAASSIVHAISGQPIQVECTFASLPGGNTYNTYVVVEKL